MSVANIATEAANEVVSPEHISPLSQELVIGLVGYAGAGCSTAASRIHMILDDHGYTVHKIKLSKLIAHQWPNEAIPDVVEGPDEGNLKLARAQKLQDLGDQLRTRHGDFAIAALAAREIRTLRGGHRVGEQKLAFIVESIKHREEVELLRRIYDQSFRMIAVHCDRPTREGRLIGSNKSATKYHGASRDHVISFMERDEKDKLNKHGQQVRDAFYLADYFIDNNINSTGGANLNDDLDRFAKLVLGSGLVRPNVHERGIYHAHSSALQSSCLSRQVGAALVSSQGSIISTGTNDVPKFGGGVYDEESNPDNRCHAWEWDPTNLKFIGCHNDRKKSDLRGEIASWLATNLSQELALAAHPPPQGLDTANRARQTAEVAIAGAFDKLRDRLDDLPGIKDLIEFSRAIHAEMSAILSAAREGISPVGGTLYCTTYPCHNCARHLVAAGIHRVYYIEPYVKSLASELHSDAIVGELPPSPARRGGSETVPTKMSVVPFTGVGPRMYEDFFAKRGALKSRGGKFEEPSAGVPSHAVRLREMAAVETAAIDLLPETE